MKTKLLLILIISSLLLPSCMKEWLEPKRDKAMAVPSTLDDIQAILDFTTVMNQGMPNLGEVSSDDYYLKQSGYDAMVLMHQKNAHIWADEIFVGETSSDWNNAYQQIFYSNLAIESLNKLSQTDQNTKGGKNLKGSALFYRAWAYYQLAQIFCPFYDINASESSLGLPLRIQSDMNIHTTRSTLQETYQLILSDLNLAYELLHETPYVKTRPSKSSALSLLAIVNLQIGDYNKALTMAEKALNISNVLLDFNNLDIAATYPFPQFNAEVLFHSTLQQPDAMYPQDLFADSVLYDSYEDSDLRKSGFFYSDGGTNLAFKGSYSGDFSYFNGITTGEILLIRAECYARIGEYEKANNDLNLLLKSRIIHDQFIPVDLAEGELIDKILEERRKELVFRGRRWSDLRRLSKEPKYAKTLLRNLNGISYKLPPNSLKYILPIPDDVVSLSGIEQNPR